MIDHHQSGMHTCHFSLLLSMFWRGRGFIIHSNALRSEIFGLFAFLCTLGFLANAQAVGSPQESAIQTVDRPDTVDRNGAESPNSLRVASFHKDAEPFLKNYCYDCHGSGSDSGNLAFDSFHSEDALLKPELWLKVIKNLRAGIMPPKDQKQPSAAEKHQLEEWIKSTAFGIDPKRGDPGRVTVRRLNRVEYRNAVRDLLGFDFDVNQAIPADDVGYGFDNISDVLSISPMRLEKFLEAAITVVDQGVPKDTVTIPSKTYYFEDFASEDGRDADHMSFYQNRTVRKKVNSKVAGDYRIHIYCKIDGDPMPRDPQECRIHVTSDGEEFFTQKYHWADNDWFEDDCIVQWKPGEHEIAFTTEVVHPELKPLRSKMEYRLVSVRVEGPLDRSHWEHPPGFDKIYFRESPPTDPILRRQYAKEILERFTLKAFRRPPSDETVVKLMDLAEQTYSLPNVTFEAGIGQAIVAILASPKFLFQLEESEPVNDGETVARIDEYGLASRLSFALWRSIPDDTLIQLAATGQLRNNFAAQVQRMVADPKSQAFVEGFSQQWLQTSVILDIPINSNAIMALEASAGDENRAAEVATNPGRGGARGFVPPGNGRGAPAGRRGGPRTVAYTGKELNPAVRAAMKQEVESYFDFVMRQDRSVLEFLKSDYIFVNSVLATLYGIPDVEGSEMRKVSLPADNPRGGVLTMGSVLTVTSNPTRTSPVKRGKWILENILGAPTAPPPPDVPALEDTILKAGESKPTQREVLAIHRENALCASCHARMDPPGLALENFNGFGRFRSTEFQKPIDAAGELITGEKFTGVSQLKEALTENHKLEFYRTLAGKLLTYVLGRGMEYYDIGTIDQIAERMSANEGRFSSMLMGVLESPPVHTRRVASLVDEPVNNSITRIGNP